MARQPEKNAEGTENMRRLLVTGGAGFIGSNFIRYWIQQHPDDRVINLDLLTYPGKPDRNRVGTRLPVCAR